MVAAGRKMLRSFNLGRYTRSKVDIKFLLVTTPTRFQRQVFVN